MFSKRSNAAAGWTDRWWTSSDGLRLHARDYAPSSGEARLPVVCLHGLTRNARDFEIVAPAIAEQGRRVLALDIRGRGESDRDPHAANYHPGVYAGDVIELMGALGIGRAQFVGTSMGGLITMTLAAVRADLVAGAVINDIGPEIAAEGLARIGSYVGKPNAVKSWGDAVRYGRETNGHAHPAFKADDWERMARRWFREGSRKKRPELDYDPNIAVPIRASAGQPLPDLWPLFDGLAANRPLLIVRGGASDLLTADAAGRMAARAPSAQVVEAGGVGHAPTLEEPEVAPALAAFFDRVA